MRFLAPERLLLLIVVAALAALYVLLLGRRKHYAVRFTNLDLLDSVAPKRPGWRRHLPASLAGVAAIALVIGMAQPTVERTVATESAVVVLTIDTSISMDATDVDPTRMQAAIVEAVAFVDGLPDTVDVGLVAFDGTARVLAPPTSDHDAITTSISQLTTDRGTAGGDAIEASVATIQVALSASAAQVAATEPPDPDTDPAEPYVTDAAPAATIVFLSDGTTTSGGSIYDAAQRAADADIPISTITYGTAAGTVDVEGRTVNVAPDTTTMADIAELTGGTAFQAADAEQLASVYDQLDSRIATTTERQELTVELMSVALAALLLAGAGAFLWTGRFI